MSDIDFKKKHMKEEKDIALTKQQKVIEMKGIVT